MPQQIWLFELMLKDPHNHPQNLTRDVLNIQMEHTKIILEQMGYEVVMDIVAVLPEEKAVENAQEK